MLTRRRFLARVLAGLGLGTVVVAAPRAASTPHVPTTFARPDLIWTADRQRAYRLVQTVQPWRRGDLVCDAARPGQVLGIAAADSAPHHYTLVQVYGPASLRVAETI